MKFSTNYKSKFTKQAQSGFTKILEQITDYIRGGGVLEPLPVNTHDQMALHWQNKNKKKKQSLS